MAAPINLNNDLRGTPRLCNQMVEFIYINQTLYHYVEKSLQKLLYLKSK